MPDFLYRMCTCINHFVSAVKEIDKNDFFKLTVVDWGSKPPLQETLQLIEGSSEIVEFINLTEGQIKTISPNLKGIHATLPHNLAIRRSSAKYFFGMGADTMLTSSSLLSLYYLCENSLATPYPMSETFLMIERKQIPWCFMNSEPNHLELDRIIKLSSFNFKSDSASMHWGGGAGVVGMSIALWKEMEGLDERSIGWGGNDTEIFLKVSKFRNWMDLSSFGIISYHMEHVPGLAGGNRTISMWTQNSYNPFECEERPGQGNWGAPHLPVKREAYLNLGRKIPLNSPKKMHEESSYEEVISFVKWLQQDLPISKLNESDIEKMLIINGVCKTGKYKKIGSIDIETPLNLLSCTLSCPEAEITTFCSTSYLNFGTSSSVVQLYRTATNFRGHVCFSRTKTLSKILLKHKKPFDLIVLEKKSSIEELNIALDSISENGLVLVSSVSPSIQTAVSESNRNYECILGDFQNMVICSSKISSQIKNFVPDKKTTSYIQTKTNSISLPKIANKKSVFNFIKTLLARCGIGIYRLKNNPNPPVFD
jgi:hypothetical protein